jgi:ADP-ribose pyrophosphatase YjhB (NUDIX family)
MSGWLEASDWKRAQETLPIACVDIVPVRLDEVGNIERVGLIFRDTPHQGLRWCMVGGRIWRNESIAEVITRQLRETLGARIAFHIDPDPQPTYVSQYFPTQREIGSLDPRQHAVTLNFVVPVTGEPMAGGEAREFQWFGPSQLPTPEEFGFGQDRFIGACLRISAMRCGAHADLIRFTSQPSEQSKRD